VRIMGLKGLVWYVLVPCTDTRCCVVYTLVRCCAHEPGWMGSSPNLKMRQAFARCDKNMPIFSWAWKTVYIKTLVFKY